MATIKLDAARALPQQDLPSEYRPSPAVPPSSRAAGATVGSQSLQKPTALQLISRSGLPLIMLVIVAGTPLWGGYVTLVLAFALWRLAGVML